MNSQKSTGKTEDTQETTCGTCAFFGKPIFCLRREKYEGALPCAIYESKMASPMYPLLPDTGIKERKEDVVERPSLLWYLVPFLFGILGGIVGYVGVKDKDQNMATGLLLFGLFMSFIDLFVVWLYLVGY